MDGLESAIFTWWLTSVSAVPGGFVYRVFDDICISALVELNVGVGVGSIIMSKKAGLRRLPRAVDIFGETRRPGSLCTCPVS